MTTVFRVAAVVIAVAAAMDPAISVTRSRPVAVEIVGGAGGAGGNDAAVRERLIAALGAGVAVAHPGQGEAIVSIDRAVTADSIREGVSVSSVLAGPPNVRLLDAAVQARFLPGHEARVDVDVQLQGVAGRTSVLTVTQNGVDVGRVERTWDEGSRQRLTVPFVSLAAGAHAVRVRAEPFADETRDADNVLDATVVTVDRPLRIAFVEPRPSWSAGFVRRALEQDPAFAVASLLRPSRGVDVRTGDAPASLTPGALEPFEVIVVGAPEELTAADLRSTRTFMADRGGTVLFLPDRRPSGPYASLVAPAGFDEVLLDTPVTLTSVRGARALRASELAIPRTPDAAMRTLLSRGGASTKELPVMVSWPVGDGTLIFSGALDAWRFRADDHDRFAAFWRAAIAEAALAAPPALRVELDPPAVRAGGDTRVVARLRRTEFEPAPDGSILLPAIRAVAVGRRGTSTTTEPVRLWPTAAPGVFQGRFTPSDPGIYYVHVIAGRSQDAALLARTDLPEAGRADDEEAAIVARATGGAVAPADDLGPVVSHIGSLRRGEVRVTVHPMRSGWWTLPFALALCAEWGLRRRRGER